MTTGFEWVEPATLEQALAQLRPGALLKVGGVDVMDRLKEGLDAPGRLVNLRRVAGLDGVRERPSGELEVGALVTLATLAGNALVRERYPALALAALRAATPNVRNVATVGGNLLQRPRCWYFRREAFTCRRKGGASCFAQEGRNVHHAIFENDVCAAVHPSDAAVALVAYGARAEIAGGAGRREVALEELFVPPGEDVGREHRVGAAEILVALRLPRPRSARSVAYLKEVERESADWPLASVAVVLDVEAGACRAASIVLGAAAPVPWRVRAAERALAGRTVSREAAEDAAREAVRGATPLAENGYKAGLFQALVRRAVLQAGRA